MGKIRKRPGIGYRDLLRSLETKNKEIEDMKEIERIREKQNREEQKRALKEYERKAREEADRQKAEMQDTVDQIFEM